MKRIIKKINTLTNYDYLYSIAKYICYLSKKKFKEPQEEGSSIPFIFIPNVAWDFKTKVIRCLDLFLRMDFTIISVNFSNQSSLSPSKVICNSLIESMKKNKEFKFTALYLHIKANYKKNKKIFVLYILLLSTLPLIYYIQHTDTATIVDHSKKSVFFVALFGITWKYLKTPFQKFIENSLHIKKSDDLQLTEYGCKVLIKNCRKNNKNLIFIIENISNIDKSIGLFEVFQEFNYLAELGVDLIFIDHKSGLNERLNLEGSDLTYKLFNNIFPIQFFYMHAMKHEEIKPIDLVSGYTEAEIKKFDFIRAKVEKILERYVMHYCIPFESIDGLVYSIIFYANLFGATTEKEINVLSVFIILDRYDDKYLNSMTQYFEDPTLEENKKWCDENNFAASCEYQILSYDKELALNLKNRIKFKSTT